MKCLRCSTDNDYRTRQANERRCTGCGGKFVFEPREGDPLTDGAFAAAIAAVSEEGRLSWLDRQLYFEVARRARRKRFFHRVTRRPLASIDDERFSKLYARWIAGYGEPAGRLQPGAFAVDVRASERAEDATAHGFDRLLVCGSDAIVDVLLANSFHADHRCAVISVSGYPLWATELVLPGFRATPPEQIAVVHDADLRGCRLAREVRTGAGWFGGGSGVSVLDAGLRPADAKGFRGLYLPGAPVNLLGDEPVTVDEAKWLGKYRLELAAVRPRVLMNILANALNRSEEEERQAVGDDGTWGWVGIWGLGGDGGGDDDAG
jgi:DNA-directed RNA polymerase subunit RPC12/RpoP